MLLHADGDIKSWLMLREAHLSGRSPRGFCTSLGLSCLSILCPTEEGSKTPHVPGTISWGLKNFTPKYMRFFKCHHPPYLPLKITPFLPGICPKLFTSSQALLGRGRPAAPLRPPFQWLVTTRQSSSTLWWWWPRRRDFGQKAWKKHSRPLSTKRFLSKLWGQSQWILQCRFFHLVYNEIINQICGVCGIKCLGVLIFLS